MNLLPPYSLRAIKASKQRASSFVRSLDLVILHREDTPNIIHRNACVLQSYHIRVNGFFDSIVFLNMLTNLEQINRYEKKWKTEIYFMNVNESVKTEG
jgi:hypothetical protein